MGPYLSILIIHVFEKPGYVFNCCVVCLVVQQWLWVVYKNNISNTRKLQKIALKGRARNYNRERTRNTYNGATVEKIQLLKNLY